MAHSLSLADHVFEAAVTYLTRDQADAFSNALAACSAILQLRRDGKGLIHLAVQQGRVGFLSILLDAGADANMREGEWHDSEQAFLPGETPLHYASYKGHLDAVEMLLSHGADANAANECSGTSLHVTNDCQIMEALLGAGADPNVQCGLRCTNEILGWYFIATPLHNVGDNAATVETLVRHGADVNAREHITLRTPLHYAAARGHKEAVKQLLDCGAHPNVICEYTEYTNLCRRSPYDYAALGEHDEVMDILRRTGGNPHNRTLHVPAR